MRGKVPQHEQHDKGHGITPACAGKSLPAMLTTSGDRDHPRMCGEKMLTGDTTDEETGSPPHVRGKAIALGFSIDVLRITPACAGKSGCPLSCGCIFWDHPRMCGEKHRRWCRARQRSGSPPHVRGKVFDWLRRNGYLRITPACAGKRLKRSRSIVPHAAIVPLFPSVCNKPAGSDGSPAGHDAPPFLPIENAVPASPAYNLRSL